MQPDTERRSAPGCQVLRPALMPSMFSRSFSKRFRRTPNVRGLPARFQGQPTFPSNVSKDTQHECFPGSLRRHDRRTAPRGRTLSPRRRRDRTASCRWGRESTGPGPWYAADSTANRKRTLTSPVNSAQSTSPDSNRLGTPPGYCGPGQPSAPSPGERFGSCQARIRHARRARRGLVERPLGVASTRHEEHLSKTMLRHDARRS